jgi:hypothetical protein
MPQTSLTFLLLTPPKVIKSFHAKIARAGRKSPCIVLASAGLNNKIDSTYKQKKGSRWLPFLFS